MKNIYYTICAILLILGSCDSKDNLNKKILGTWYIHRIYDGEKDVTNEHNPKNDRWIKFNKNGSFESDGTPYGYNDGNWELDIDKSTLFIDSKIENDDSEWNIIFKGEEFIWTGIGTPRQENFKIVQKKRLE